jgi:hypothetical protein
MWLVVRQALDFLISNEEAFEKSKQDSGALDPYERRVPV